jgi:hypothetical protein
MAMVVFPFFAQLKNPKEGSTPRLQVSLHGYRISVDRYRVFVDGYRVSVHGYRILFSFRKLPRKHKFRENSPNLTLLLP